LAGALPQIPLGGAYSAPQTPQLDLREPTPKGRERRKDGKEGQGKGRKGSTSKVRGKGRGKGEKLLPGADRDDTPGWEYHLSM